MNYSPPVTFCELATFGDITNFSQTELRQKFYCLQGSNSFPSPIQISAPGLIQIVSVSQAPEGQPAGQSVQRSVSAPSGRSTLLRWSRSP